MLMAPRSEMAERALGADDIGKLAPPGVDQQHRHDGEGGAKEHDLAERHRLFAEIAHAGRKQREQERGEGLEQKGFDHVHRVAQKRRCPAFAGHRNRPSYFGSGGFGPSTGGSDLM